MLIKKKIAFVVSSTYTIVSFMPNHIKELSNIFDVHVLLNLNNVGEKKNLSFRKTDIFGDLERYATFHHIDLVRRISILKDIKSLIFLCRFFKREGFSSVHSITSKAGLITMMAANMAGVKSRLHVYTGQVWVNKKGVVRLFFKLMDKTIARLSTNCYADSNSQMHYLVQENIISKQKISVLGAGSISGVDTTRFFPNYEICVKMREKLKIPKNDIVYLFLCRITVDKGIFDLVNAFSKLVKEFDCCLLIVGPDEENLTNKIISRIDKEYRRKLIFHGYTNRHEDFLQVANVLCQPSYREGFGSVIIDAAAIGIPTIGSDIYGIRDAVDRNKTGILHEVGNVDEIYKSMKLLGIDNNLREKLGQAALNRVHMHFKMEDITEAWVREYRTQLGDV